MDVEETYSAYSGLLGVMQSFGFIRGGEMALDACEFIIWQALVELEHHSD